jgi:hypothetical protein
VAISFKDRRTQLAAGGGLVAALIVLVLVKVLFGGGGSESAQPPTVFTPNPVTSPSPSANPTTTPPPIEVFGGRDPFQPLFVSTTSPTSPAPSPSGSGSPTPTPTGTGSPTSGGSSKPSSTTIGGHTVQLDDVFVSTSGVKKAQVEVDGTVYTVAAGQTFDDNFKLVSFVGDPCGNFVFGDQPFELCTAGGK